MSDTNAQGLLNTQGGDNGATATNTVDPTILSGGTANPTSDPNGGGDPTVPNNKGVGAGDGDFGKNWKEYIPEELKDRNEWNNIKDVSDLYKNYINAQQTISKSVRMPDANSTPEDIAAFYQKLGKPASKDDYDFDYTPAKKEYVLKKDSYNFDVFKEIAEKANLTKDQYQRLASAYIDINNENYINYHASLQAQAADELKKAEASLRGEWGTGYQQNINSITDRINKLYSKNTIDRMQNAGLFRDPDFLKAHLKLTKMMTGDTVFIEGNAVENVPQTLQTLIEKRDKLMSEDYKKNMDTVQSLNKQIVNLKMAQSQGASKFVG